MDSQLICIEELSELIKSWQDNVIREVLLNGEKDGSLSTLQKTHAL